MSKLYNDTFVLYHIFLNLSLKTFSSFLLIFKADFLHIEHRFCKCKHNHQKTYFFEKILRLKYPRFNFSNDEQIIIAPQNGAKNFNTEVEDEAFY